MTHEPTPAQVEFVAEALDHARKEGTLPADAHPVVFTLTLIYDAPDHETSTHLAEQASEAIRAAVLALPTLPVASTAFQVAAREAPGEGDGEDGTPEAPPDTGEALMKELLEGLPEPLKELVGKVMGGPRPMPEPPDLHAFFSDMREAVMKG